MQRSAGVAAAQPPPTFSATLAQPEGFRAVLKFAAAFTDVLKLGLDGEGLRIEAVDGAKSAFLDAFFSASGSDSSFKSWRLGPESLALHLDPRSVAKLLRAAGGGAGALLSTLSLAVGPPRQDSLALCYSTLTKHGVTQRSRFEVALLSLQGECAEVEMDASLFDFTAQLLSARPAILADVVAQLKAAGCSEVAVTLTGDSATFSSVGPDLPICCEITLEEHSDGSTLCLAADEPCTAAFHFKYFERLATLCKVSSQVVLQLGPEAPLSLVCQLAGGGFVRLFLAPLVDERSGMGSGMGSP